MGDILKAVVGIRAITHISLIALHTAMITTGNLPSSGELWNAFRSSWYYTFSQAGGIQVDIMFMLSGFLLTYLFLKGKSLHPFSSVGSFLSKRVFRLLPSIVVISIIGLLLGDSWDIDAPAQFPFINSKGLSEHTGVPIWQRFLTMWTFIQNYLPSEKFGSFTLTLCWSCCVDMQAGLAIYLIMCALERFCTKNSGIGSSFVSPMISMLLLSFIIYEEATNKISIARYGLVIFGMAAIASTLIRWALFEKSSLNIFLLGQHSHFGLLQSDSSYQWIQDHYHHEWKTTNAAAHLSHVYMNGLYLPTHTRFGPMAIGAFLGCNLYLSWFSYDWKESENKKPHFLVSTVQRLLVLLLTFLALAQLVIPCLPSSDDVPLAMQQFATACIRNFAALASAFLLFRCLVPRKSVWYAPVLDFFLSSSFWSPVSKLSFCSYLIHFRVLMELNFQAPIRRWLSWLVVHMEEIPVSSSVTKDLWIQYMLTLFVVTLIISLLLAYILHINVEMKCIQWYEKSRSDKSKTA